MREGAALSSSFASSRRTLVVHVTWGWYHRWTRSHIQQEWAITHREKNTELHKLREWVHGRRHLHGRTSPSSEFSDGRPCVCLFFSPRPWSFQNIHFSFSGQSSLNRQSWETRVPSWGHEWTDPRSGLLGFTHTWKKTPEVLQVVADCGFHLDFQLRECYSRGSAIAASFNSHQDVFILCCVCVSHCLLPVICQRTQVVSMSWLL